mmetsp:Transcript_71179/g.133127  ORF Transcript_71179/g.133127 Transcript_71179/m.133127 type:complete len:168 (-) Transcript_71179:317-820(-)
MADFSDKGRHCSHPYCKQQDFLPFECDLCHQTLCKDHLRYEDHDCPHKSVKDVRVEVCPICDITIKKVDGEDLAVTLEKHAGTPECLSAAQARAALQEKRTQRCPVRGCKAKLTESGSVCCQTCGVRTCLKHRFEDQHECKPVTKKPLTAAFLAGMMARERIPVFAR